MIKELKRGAKLKKANSSCKVEATGNVKKKSKSKERENQSKIFTKIFDKITLSTGEMQAKCRFCTTTYKYTKGGGYGSLDKHVKRMHLVE